MQSVVDGWRKFRDCLLGMLGQQAMPRASAGDRAETLAARFLESHGARIIARNVRCRGGEIDLVAQHGSALLFVEVRLRSRGDYGGAASSITTHKQKRVAHAARVWLSGEGRRHAKRAMRFDAVLLDSIDMDSIEWIQGAFSAD